MDSTQHPFDAIARGNVVPATKDQLSPPDTIQSDARDQQENVSREPSSGNHAVRSTASMLHALNLTGLNSPAIILDQSLRVVWQNKLAIDHIWCRSRTANNGNPTPDIFNLLFDQQFRLEVDNWRQWVSFFAWHILEFIPAQTLDHHLGEMDARQRDVISAIIALHKSEPGISNSSERYLRQVRTHGDIYRFEVTAIDFSEGRLIVFVPIDNPDGAPALRHSREIQRRFDMVRSHPNPVNVEFSVLSACLSNAAALKTELLATDYCRLISDICKICIDIIETHGGCFVKHADNAFAAYFLRADEHDDFAGVNTSRCALDIKTRMVEFNREWKLRAASRYEIELNMGIHYDKGYMGILSSSVGDSLTSYGDALNIAAALARMAGNGEIWATKPVVAGMPESMRTRLRFGIHRTDSYRRQALLRNIFTKARNLPGGVLLSAEGNGELEDMAVAQIFDFEA